MLKGFKEFLLRGNVIELAVAVVIGGAFTAIVTAVVTGVLNPLIGALFNAGNLAKALPVTVPAISGGEPGIIYFGAVIAAIINFVLVAVVIYFGLILPMRSLEKFDFLKKKQADASATEAKLPPTEVELLTEIRDLLRGSGGADALPAALGGPTPPAAPRR
jgi:large conductance mechanosensitive channel